MSIVSCLVCVFTYIVVLQIHVLDNSSAVIEVFFPLSPFCVL
jgi:hypothetical protein